MGRIKLIGETLDCRILPREEEKDRGNPRLKPETKRRTKSDRNGTESSFMFHEELHATIYAEFTRNNFATSNSFAKVLALSELFVYSYILHLIASSAEKIIDAINFDQLFRAYYIIMTICCYYAMIIFILIGSLRESGSSISH